MAKKKAKKRGRKPTRTVARAAFDKNANRASSFLAIHEAETKNKQGAPTGPFRELPRGAVVFAVGALDAYLSEVSAEVMVRQLQAAPGDSTARGVLKKVQSQLPGLALEASLLGTQKERAERIQQGVTEFFHEQVSQHGPKAVTATVMRIGGDKDRAWAAVEAKHTKAQATLDSWTKKRHHIVHQGKSEQITRPQAEDCIALIQAIARAVDTECLRALAAL